MYNNDTKKWFEINIISVNNKQKSTQFTKASPPMITKNKTKNESTKYYFTNIISEIITLPSYFFNMIERFTFSMILTHSKAHLIVTSSFIWIAEM